MPTGHVWDARVYAASTDSQNGPCLEVGVWVLAVKSWVTGPRLLGSSLGGGRDSLWLFASRKVRKRVCFSSFIAEFFFSRTYRRREASGQSTGGGFSMFSSFFFQMEGGLACRSR